MVMSILERVRLLMQANNIENLHQLAVTSGINYGTLVTIFKRSDPQNIGIMVLKKLRAALNCTGDYLLFGDDRSYEELQAMQTWDSMSDLQRAEIIGVLKFIKQNKENKK